MLFKHMVLLVLFLTNIANDSDVDRKIRRHTHKILKS